MSDNYEAASKEDLDLRLYDDPRVRGDHIFEYVMVFAGYRVGGCLDVFTSLMPAVAFDSEMGRSPLPPEQGVRGLSLVREPEALRGWARSTARSQRRSPRLIDRREAFEFDVSVDVTPVERELGLVDAQRIEQAVHAVAVVR